LISYYAAGWMWGVRRRRRPDVVIGTTVHPLAAELARRVAAHHRATFVYEVTDLWPASLVDLGATTESSPLYRVLSTLEGKALRAASGVIGLMPLLPEYAREHHRLEIERFCYAPNGIDGRRLVNPRNQAVHGRLLYSGGFVAAHGLDAVLKAARILEDRTPGRFTVELVGDGPERPRLESMAKDMSLTNVRFPGWVRKSDLPKVISEADICLCVSNPMAVHRYGMSFNKLFDYFAAARPVIFAMRSGNNPVAEAGAGRTVEPGDAEGLARAVIALGELGADERDSLGMRGYEYLSRHHVLEHVAANIDEFLMQILPSSSRSYTNDPPTSRREVSGSGAHPSGL
jgi:glycosyltransferase involved in cell wall biosynthesis